MHNLIKKIYDEMYSEKLTIQSLVTNIKADNYISVNFYKENELIICETKCYLKNGDKTSYKYCFENDKLIKLTQETNNEITVLYDREIELSYLFTPRASTKS